MDSKQRKLQNNLSTSGTALIAVSLLEALQLLIYWLVDTTQIDLVVQLFAEAEISVWIFYALLIGVTLADVIVGCFIGFSARAEAKGKKKSRFYIVVAIIMAVFLTLGTLIVLIGPFFSELDVFAIFDAVVSTILTSVVIYAIIDIVVCSQKCRKMNKAQQEAVQDNTNKDEEVTA